MIKKIITSPYFYIPAILIVVGLIIWWISSLIKSAPPQLNPLTSVQLPNSATGTYMLTVSNSKGAVIYTNANELFNATAQKVAFNTKLSGELYQTATGTWYKTNKGYLSANDIAIQTTSPH